MPNAVITTVRPAGISARSVRQYIADEKANLAAMSSARGTVEHDYVQSFGASKSGQAIAVSELTTYMHEVVAKKQASVDVVVKREYVLEPQDGAWRIIRLKVTPMTVTINGKRLSLVRPRLEKLQPSSR